MKFGYNFLLQCLCISPGYTHQHITGRAEFRLACALGHQIPSQRHKNRSTVAQHHPLSEFTKTIKNKIAVLYDHPLW